MDESEALRALTQAYLLRVYRRPLAKESPETLNSWGSGQARESDAALEGKLQDIIKGSIGAALDSFRSPKGDQTAAWPEDVEIDNGSPEYQTASTAAPFEHAGSTSSTAMTVSPMTTMTGTMDVSTSLTGTAQKTSPGPMVAESLPQGLAFAALQKKVAEGKPAEEIEGGPSQASKSSSSGCQPERGKSKERSSSKTSVRSASKNNEGEQPKASAKTSSKEPAEKLGAQPSKTSSKEPAVRSASNEKLSQPSKERPEKSGAGQTEPSGSKARVGNSRKAPPEIQVESSDVREPSSPRSRNRTSKKVENLSEAAPSGLRKRDSPPRKGALDRGEPSSPRSNRQAAQESKSHQKVATRPQDDTASKVPEQKVAEVSQKLDSSKKDEEASGIACEHSTIPKDLKESPRAQSLSPQHSTLKPSARTQSMSPQGRAESSASDGEANSKHRKGHRDETPDTLTTLDNISISETPDTFLPFSPSPDHPVIDGLLQDPAPHWYPGQVYFPRPHRPNVPDHLTPLPEQQAKVPCRPRDARNQANPRKRTAPQSEAWPSHAKVLPKLEPEGLPKGAGWPPPRPANKVRSSRATSADIVNNHGALHPDKDPVVLATRDQAQLRRKFEQNLQGVKQKEEIVNYMQQKLQTYHYASSEKAQRDRVAATQEKWRHRRHERIMKSGRLPKDAEVDFAARQMRQEEEARAKAFNATHGNQLELVEAENSASVQLPPRDCEKEQKVMWENYYLSATGEQSFTTMPKQNTSTDSSGEANAGPQGLADLPLSDPCCRSARSVGFSKRFEEPRCRIAWRARADSRLVLPNLDNSMDPIVPTDPLSQSQQGFALPRLAMPPRVPPNVLHTILAKRTL